MGDSTKGELAPEEKLVKLASRTGLKVSLLKKLPEEKISDYFNRTADRVKKPGEYFLAMGFSGGGAAGASLGSGDIGQASFFAVLSLVCLVGSSLRKEFAAANENEKAKAEIQADIASLIP